MGDNLTTLLNQAIEENRHEKICLIEDIIKIKKHLYSQGDTQHDEFLTHEGQHDLLFKLIDMEMLQLNLIYKSYEKRANELILEKIPSLL